jgi:hypothetical protein
MEQLHPGTNGDQVCSNIEPIGHDEGHQENAKNGATKTIEALYGQLADTGSSRQSRSITDFLHCSH